MDDLTKEEVLDLSRKYDNDESQWDSATELSLGEKFRKNGQITKDDLQKVIGWKFITNPHRLKRETNLLAKVEDEKIRATSKAAFAESDDRAKLRKLMHIKGVGLAVASTILTFSDPDNFCIFDIHIFDEFFGTDPATRPKIFSAKHYLALLDKIRLIARSNGVSARTVEKAYFKKNLDES